VRQRDDRFLVAFAHVQRLELGLQGAARSSRCLGKLAQQPAHPGIAFANTSALAFARAFRCCPRQMPTHEAKPFGAAEDTHVRADLHQQHRRARPVDAGQGLQQVQLRLHGRSPSSRYCSMRSMRCSICSMLLHDLVGHEGVARR